MRVYVACVLNCPPDRVWNEVQTSALLLEVCRPLIRFAPVDPPQFPNTWTEGGTIRCRSFLFGFIPLGTRTLFAERIDQVAHELQSRERDPLIRRWDHLIRVRPADGGRTRYSDEIVIEAGMLTPLVWSFAQWFYRHRQRRWHRGSRNDWADDGCKARAHLDRHTVCRMQASRCQVPVHGS